ncbi:MAG: CHASE2 domain-containing protein [Pseudomonadota bacterium]
MTKAQSRSALRTLGFATILIILATAIFPSAVARLEDRLLRALSPIARPASKPTEIVIAAIDERSFKELGSWPWGRGAFMQLIDRLRSSDAGLIVFESRVADEANLADMRLPVMREGGTDIVAGYRFYPTLADMPPASERTGDNDESVEDKLAFLSTPSDDASLPTMAGVKINRFTPAERLLVVEGFGNLFPDADGVVRGQPLAARLGHRVFPALPLVAAAEWMGFTPIISENGSGRPAGAAIGNMRIETGRDMRLELDFRGGRSSFSTFSAADIVGGRVPKEALDNHVVLVGITAAELGHYYRTPMGRMAAVEITANAIDDILLGRSITAWGGRIHQMLFVIVLGLAFSLLIARLNSLQQITVAAVIAASLIATETLVLRHTDIWLPAAWPAVAAAILLAVSLAWRSVAVHLPRMRVKAALCGRIGANGIAAIASDPSLMSPKIRPVEVTALSADIKGFGAIASRIAPTDLARFLKEYRGLVSDILIRHGAFIDSWASDECRAVFGAPVPGAGLELPAARAALALQRMTASKRDDWEKTYGIDKLRIGIGIQSGTAAAGNAGAAGPSPFGVTGGAVEASCMLRALNRIYRTSILVGDAPAKATGDVFKYRPLDPVALRGETSQGMIHELVGEAKMFLPQMDRYMEARSHYLKGDFAGAAHLFEELLAVHPHDGPSHVLLRRSLALSKNPPEWKWDGVWKKS